ncbi:MAG: hypothetical protein JRI68_28980 [Deltaproteobacteria bacterium]|nr:hypothetical protein [Deltaproteobacteria bacterium]
MRVTATLLVLLAIGTLGCTTPQPPPADVMPAARHCELALARAQEGDCLGAGEHLAFCRGAQANDNRAAARQLCAGQPPTPLPPPPDGPPPPPTAAPPPPPTTTVAPPPGPAPTRPNLIDPWTRPTPPPTSTQPSSAVPPLHDDQADRACDEAIAAAQRSHCGLAQAHLLKCRGAKQPAAQTEVRRTCPLVVQGW